MVVSEAYKTARVYFRRNGKEYVQFEIRRGDNIKDISPRQYKHSELETVFPSQTIKDRVNDLLRRTQTKLWSCGKQIEFNLACRSSASAKVLFLTKNNIFQV